MHFLDCSRLFWLLSFSWIYLFKYHLLWYVLEFLISISFLVSLYLPPFEQFRLFSYKTFIWFIYLIIYSISHSFCLFILSSSEIFFCCSHACSMYPHPFYGIPLTQTIPFKPHSQCGHLPSTGIPCFCSSPVILCELTLNWTPCFCPWKYTQHPYTPFFVPPFFVLVYSKRKPFLSFTLSTPNSVPHTVFSRHSINVSSLSGWQTTGKQWMISSASVLFVTTLPWVQCSDPGSLWWGGWASVTKYFPNPPIFHKMTTCGI